jgi:DNA-binding PadR family transcriptional regulator
MLVLLVLADGDLHGYRIMKEVERQSQGRVRLEVGSLYRTLSRLLDSGLIEETGAGADTAPTTVDAERRRNYHLAPHGREVVQVEVARLQDVLRLATAKGLAGVTEGQS